jgi:hypothetical protein
MANRIRARSVVFLSLGVIILALLVDRIALYTWSLSVIRQFQRYRQTALAASDYAHPQTPVSISEITEPPLWIGPITSPGSRPTDVHSDCVNVRISLEPALARPDFVSIIGQRLALRYLPPRLAWTTRIFRLRPFDLPYRLYRSKDHYGYSIAADFADTTRPPIFRLYRVTSFSQKELPGDTRLPELFP